MTETPHQDFDGYFDAEFRTQLQQRRLEANFTYRELAETLKVNPSTIKKWEQGTITKCQPQQIARVAKFLRGDFTKNRRISQATQDVICQLPVEFTSQLANVFLVYQKCGATGAVQQMLSDLQSLTDQCLFELGRK